jgi:hypothetical protein
MVEETDEMPSISDERHTQFQGNLNTQRIE